MCSACASDYEQPYDAEAEAAEPEAAAVVAKAVAAMVAKAVLICEVADLLHERVYDHADPPHAQPGHAGRTCEQCMNLARKIDELYSVALAKELKT